jgi:hypothetical protein
VIQDSIIPLVSLLSSGPKVLNSSVSTNEYGWHLNQKFQSVSILTFTKEFNFLLALKVYFINSLLERNSYSSKPK